MELARDLLMMSFMAVSSDSKVTISKIKSAAPKRNNPRKRSPRSAQKVQETAVFAAGSMERTRRLLLAALRVWELKRRRVGLD